MGGSRGVARAVAFPAGWGRTSRGRSMLDGSGRVRGLGGVVRRDIEAGSASPASNGSCRSRHGRRRRGRAQALSPAPGGTSRERTFLRDR